MAAPKGTGMIGAGSAALRKVMSGSLGRKNTSADNLNSLSTSDALAGDSINSIIEGEIIPRLLNAPSTGAE